MSILWKPFSDIHHFFGQGQIGHVGRARVVIVRVLWVTLRTLLHRVALVGASEVGLAILDVPAQGNQTYER